MLNEKLIIANRLEALNAKLLRLKLEQKNERRIIKDEIEDLEVQQAEIAAEENSLVLIQEENT